MVLPTVAAISQDALQLVPYRTKEAAYGMGATRWEAILKVMLPTAAGGIFGALVLGFGRALGETMALAMLIGNSNQISLSLFAPANTLASLLASNFPEAGEIERQALMYAALVLLAITLIVNIAGNFMLALTTRRISGRQLMASTEHAGRPNLNRSFTELRAITQRRPDRGGLGDRAARRGAAGLGALHADRERRRAAQRRAVHRTAAGRVRDGRRLRQRHRRHAGDGRHRRR